MCHPSAPTEGGRYGGRRVISAVIPDAAGFTVHGHMLPWGSFWPHSGAMPMPTNGPLIILPGSASPTLTEAMCRELRLQPGRCEAKHFSDGNTFVRIGDNVRGADVFVIQTLSFPVNDRFMELLFLIDAAKR